MTPEDTTFLDTTMSRDRRWLCGRPIHIERTIQSGQTETNSRSNSGSRGTSNKHVQVCGAIFIVIVKLALQVVAVFV